MSFGFGIGDIETVINLGLKLRNFFRSIKDAPNDFKALRAEAECLEICLNVIQYRETASIIARVSPAQGEDLKAIVRGCRINMSELTKFIAKCQRIIADSTGGTPPGWSLWNWFKEQKGKLWAKMEFVNADKQPMRDRLAIPTQSLNIYLVSLTFVSLTYNGRLSYGPTGQPPFVGSMPVPPLWTEDWALVGGKVAFKKAIFPLSDLLRPGIEDEIIECARRKVGNKGDKGKGKKPSANAGSVRVPRGPPRKVSVGARALNTDPEGMFLVRSKSRAQSRSRVNSSVEIVKADYDFGSDSGSDSVGFDGEPISPPRGSSPPRGPRDLGDFYETRSPRQWSPSPPPPPRGNAAFGTGARGHHHPYGEDEEWEDTLRRLRRRAHPIAQEEIIEDREEGIEELTEGYEEEIIASDSRERRRQSTAPYLPDIRTYMEATYGVIINPVSPEVEAINLRTTSAAYGASHSRMEGKRREDGRHSKRAYCGDEGDSDIDEKADLSPQISARLSRASRTHDGARHKVKQSEKIEITSFKIPNTDYVPMTETYAPGLSSRDGREQERFLREQERSIKNREESLLNREEALTARERALAARERDLYGQDEHRSSYSPPYMSGARSPPIIIRANRPEERRAQTYNDEVIRLRPERSGPSTRRPKLYSAQDELEEAIKKEKLVRRRDDSDDESTYERRVFEETQPPPPPSETRRRTRRRSRDSEDDHD